MSRYLCLAPCSTKGNEKKKRGGGEEKKSSKEKEANKKSKIVEKEAHRELYRTSLNTNKNGSKVSLK